jgi:cytoskeletal protein RodZ
MMQVKLPRLAQEFFQDTQPPNKGLQAPPPPEDEEPIAVIPKRRQTPAVVVVLFLFAALFVLALAIFRVFSGRVEATPTTQASAPASATDKLSVPALNEPGATPTRPFAERDPSVGHDPKVISTPHDIARAPTPPAPIAAPKNTAAHQNSAHPSPEHSPSSKSTPPAVTAVTPPPVTAPTSEPTVRGGFFSTAPGRPPAD